MINKGRSSTKLQNLKGGAFMSKKSLLVIVAAALLLSMASVALAADITPKTYDRKYNDGTTQTVTHPYGFWNNPTTAGREAYNYNNPQDYTTGS